MAQNDPIPQPAKPSVSLAEKLTSLPKFYLYIILIFFSSAPLFINVTVPNKPLESTIDLYATLMSVKKGETVLVASDWTNSTRGESWGQFNSVMRILMRRGVNVVLYSTGDAQAPRVAQDSIAKLNKERLAQGEPEYKRWENFVSVGFFSSGEAATNGMATNVKATFAGRKDFAPGRGLTDVYESPILKGREKIDNFPLLIVITGSKTSNITVERLSGKVPIAFTVTGVMGPETGNFYQSGQIVGFASGLKGLYDLEGLMDNGVNVPGKDGQIVVKSEKYPKIDGFPGQPNAGQGSRYYPTLHFAVALLILAVIIGNVGMFLARKGAK